MKKLISQGAEAKIFLDKDIIHKDRIPKTYRHPQLDIKIRTRRTKSESKILIKALEAGINVPKVINTEKHSIQIQHIPGDRLSETLNDYPEVKQFKVMQQLGEQTALLHKNNIIHGDLTTSNTILATKPLKTADTSPTKDKEGGRLSDPNTNERSSTNSLYIIDFGLGFISPKIEDKAVDLHLIKQALEAKHFQNHEDLFKNFLKTYKDEEVIKRLEVVEKRGRYKH
jgi:tRNA A-37 threonylcarbamoyl transferase component Bud32